MENWRILIFRTVADIRGKLTFVEGMRDIPFNIKRVYYIYDVEIDVIRGQHAHHSLEQVMIAVSGRFTLELFDGMNKAVFTLDKPNEGIYIPRLVWRKFYNFEPGTVILVLASDYYKPEDYIMDFNEFLSIVRGGFNEGSLH